MIKTTPIFIHMMILLLLQLPNIEKEYFIKFLNLIKLLTLRILLPIIGYKWPLQLKMNTKIMKVLLYCMEQIQWHILLVF